MNEISIKHLRYFHALAEHRHFGRAAQACTISQPALSVQIRELETILGSPLVERTTRRIILTPLGEMIAAKATTILDSIEDLGNVARTANKPFNGRFRLGIIPTIAPYMLPRIIQQLIQTYPEINIHPREAITQTLIQDLADSKIDAAIVALPVSELNIEEYPLFDEDFVLVQPTTPKGKHKNKGITASRLLLLEEGHCFRDQAVSYCKNNIALPRDMIEGSSLSTLVQMVGAGIGVTLIPEMAVQQETRAAPVTISRLPEPQPKRTIGLIWRKTNPLRSHLIEMAKHLSA